MEYRRLVMKYTVTNKIVYSSASANAPFFNKRINVMFLQFVFQSVSGTDAAGHTALHKAAMNGSLECAQHLIACGADVNATDIAGTFNLHMVGQLSTKLAGRG